MAANRNILANPTVSGLTGAEFLYLVQNNADFKITLEQISQYNGAGLYTATADTTTSTITLNLNSYKDVILTGSASIGVGKTIALSNATNGKRLNFLFTLTDNYAFIFPNTVKMQNFVGDWNASTFTWTPVGGAGDYRAELYFNGTNWLMNIYGPH